MDDKSVHMFASYKAPETLETILPYGKIAPSLALLLSLGYTHNSFSKHTSLICLMPIDTGLASYKTMTCAQKICCQPCFMLAWKYFLPPREIDKNLSGSPTHPPSFQKIIKKTFFYASPLVRICFGMPLLRLNRQVPMG